MPIDVTASNPVLGSPFHAFRIQTVRGFVDDADSCEPFTVADDPFDDRIGPSFFALYGVEREGLLEHIADRGTYAAAVRLAGRLAPGIDFPGAAHSESWGCGRRFEDSYREWTRMNANRRQGR